VPLVELRPPYNENFNAKNVPQANLNPIEAKHHVLLVLLESLRWRRVPKNARIVHLVGTVATKTLIRPHALIVQWGNFHPKMANRFVWRATRVHMQTNTVQRYVRFAQQDLHKVRNVVPHVFDAKMVCCPTKMHPKIDGIFKAPAVLHV